MMMIFILIEYTTPHDAISTAHRTFNPEEKPIHFLISQIVKVVLPFGTRNKNATLSAQVHLERESDRRASQSKYNTFE